MSRSGLAALAAVLGAVCISCGSSLGGSATAASTTTAGSATSTPTTIAAPAPLAGVIPGDVPDGAQIKVPSVADTGSIQACQTERAEIITAYQTARVLQQGGGTDSVRDYLANPSALVYFAVPTGATTGAIPRTAASLKRVPDAAPCAAISPAEVPVGSR